MAYFVNLFSPHFPSLILFESNLLHPLDHLHIILKFDSIDRIFLFEGDPINGWAVMDEIVQEPFLPVPE